MIQRKQTLYIAIALILSFICADSHIAYFTPQDFQAGVPGTFTDTMGGFDATLPSVPLYLLPLISLPVGVAAILLFKHRFIQMVLCVVNVLLFLSWYVLAAILINNQIQANLLQPSFRFAFFIPALCIILYLLARQAISNDEQLVRSLDRIR